MNQEDNSQENHQAIISKNTVTIIIVALIVIATGIAALTYQLVAIQIMAKRSAKIETAKIQYDREQKAIEFAKNDESLRK